MIEVGELSFTYRGNTRRTLKDLSFQVERGEVLGFLGPSGAGKSTTQKLLIGMLAGFEGHVTVMDRPINSWGQELYQRVGVAFERPSHFLKLTALENLRYFQSLYSGETRDPVELLEMVGLADDASRRVSKFSKGMMVRLSFARALLNRPDLLFLDEPTTGLDPVNARNIKDRILELRDGGATVFLTTHNMSVAEDVCDRVAFIVDGSLALIDSPRRLMLQHGRRSIRVEYGDHETQSVEFPLDGLPDNQAFLETLRRENLQTIHSQETTLERIFIEVTGRQLQ